MTLKNTEKGNDIWTTQRKKSLKIPKGQSESVYRRRQHNGQKKKYKRSNNDQQNIHIKPKIE